MLFLLNADNNRQNADNNDFSLQSQNSLIRDVIYELHEDEPQAREQLQHCIYLSSFDKDSMDK